MQVPDGHAGEEWTDVLGWSQGTVTIGEDVSDFRREGCQGDELIVCAMQGWADFRSPPRSVSVWASVKARGREEFGKQE